MKNKFTTYIVRYINKYDFQYKVVCCLTIIIISNNYNKVCLCNLLC